MQLSPKRVKIDVVNTKGELLKTILRQLRPGGTNRAWYVLFDKMRLKVHGDSMDDVFRVEKKRYVVLGEE